MQNKFYFKGNFSNIYKKSSKFSEVTSQILYGEKFKILSKNKNWIKIKSDFDNYTGYIQNKNFSKEFRPNYKVSSLRAIIYKKPNLKTNIFLSLGSKLSVKETNKNYARIDKNKWIKKKDIKNINYREKNFIKIFKKFLSVKYIWGGKSYRGIDCSALLQIFYYYNNKFFPRDTKDQIKYLKGNIKKNYKKGDIIFWKGHVAICLNSNGLIHAYGPRKKVLIMPIRKTIKLIERTANLKILKVISI